MKFFVLLMSLIFVSLQGCGLLEEEGDEDGKSVETVACGVDGECPDGQVCPSSSPSSSRRPHPCKDTKISDINKTKNFIRSSNTMCLSDNS
jgi:hypothetical protein